MWLTACLHRPLVLEGGSQEHHGGPCLERDSIDSSRNRLATRRCSLENARPGQVVHPSEEVPEVCPREDSIKLAKRRMSHEVSADTGGCGAATADWALRADQAHHVVHWAADSVAGSVASSS